MEIKDTETALEAAHSVSNPGVLSMLFESECYVPSKGRSRITYPSPQELITPFLEHLRPLSNLGIVLRVERSHGVTVQGRNGEDHTAYGRFLIEAMIGPENTAAHRKTIGFIVALDVARPEVQVYSGFNATACLNLLIFRKDAYLKADMLRGGEEAVYSMTKTFVDSFGQDEQEFIRKVRSLQEVVMNERDINKTIGKLYRTFLTKGNLTSTLNYAVRLMCNPDSRYAIAPDGTTTAWNFLSAMTQYISDKAYVNVRASKTLELIEALTPELRGVNGEVSA